MHDQGISAFSRNDCHVLQVLSVALPALGTVLADPLMSLVDTACVGQLSSVELAALGPNTAIFNFVFQVRNPYSVVIQPTENVCVTCMKNKGVFAVVDPILRTSLSQFLMCC